MNKKIKTAVFLATLNATPLLASAAIQDPCTLINQLFTVVKIFGSVILVVAVIMLLWSGFLFLVGGGNEETIKKAKTILIYALIGLAVALLATSARFIVGSILPGATLLTQCSIGV